MAAISPVRSSSANPGSFTQEAKKYAPTYLDTIDTRTKAGVVKTYAYTAAQVAITAGAGVAAATCLAPLSAGVATASFFTATGCMFGALMSSKGSFMQHAMFVGMATGMGVMLSSLASVVAAPTLLAAAAMTVVASAALTGAAMLMPAGKFRSWEGPLLSVMIGFTVVGLATLVLPASWPIVAAMRTMEPWMGLGIFGAAMLVDTGRMVEQAGSPDFDPIAHSTLIYLDVLNLFVNLVQIMDK